MDNKIHAHVATPTAHAPTAVRAGEWIEQSKLLEIAGELSPGYVQRLTRDAFISGLFWGFCIGATAGALCTLLAWVS